MIPSEDRLAWAGEKLTELGQAVNCYLADASRIGLGKIRTHGVTEVSMTMNALPPPPRLSLMVGDVIHNLRASLDNLVWELAPVAAQDNKGISFLIRASLSDFERASARLKPLRPPLVDAIRDVQPFVTPEQGGLPHGGGDLLLRLDQFWNGDKHCAPAGRAGWVSVSLPPTGAFEGDFTHLPDDRLHIEFYSSRSVSRAVPVTLTVADLDRIHRVILNEVVPRLRAA